MNAQGIARRAFTLVELLVVIAVVAILIGVLLPSLASARQVAQSLIGLSQTRQLVIAQQTYASSSSGWFPGPNTSGAIAVGGEDRIAGSTGPDMPTARWDWISPSMGTELGLSPNRAERIWQIWDRFRCPRATSQVATLFGSAPDGDDFEEIQEVTPYPQISYLTPNTFHGSPVTGGLAVWIPSRLRDAIPSTARPDQAVFKAFSDPCEIPGSFRPRSDLLQRPDEKIGVADGTRFLTRLGGGLIGGAFGLDFDIGTGSSIGSPSINGNFGTSGAIFHQSRAYGRSLPDLPFTELNVDLSMRYFDREMHVAFFDGHADRISSREAWSRVEYWYPRGSVFTGGNATSESKEAYDIGDVIP